MSRCRSNGVRTEDSCLASQSIAPVSGLRLHRAEALSGAPANAGAIAFFRSGDTNLGEFTKAVLIGAFGDVPNDLSEL